MDTADLFLLQKVPHSQKLRNSLPLKFLPHHTNVFDNVSVTGSDSELSGPFSEVVYSKEFENKRRGKQLYGRDLYKAFSFSPKFKSAMEKIKKEKVEVLSGYIKTSEVISDNFELKPAARSKRDCVVFEFPNIDYGEEREEGEEEKKNKNGGSEKKKSMKVCWDEDEFFDTMSGYWRLLSCFDEFRISPPWYDAYAQGKEHWLQTEPIPTEILESSRMKCLNWLTNYFGK